MKTLYTLNRPLTARFVAAVTVVSLLLSAFPAAFFVAYAATNVFMDGFEPSTNLGNWTVTSGWNSAGDQKHSGTKSAKLAGPSNNNNGGTQVMSKAISTAGYESVAVSFWYRASDLEWSQNQGGFDKVEVSYTVDGSTWVEFNQIDGNSNDDNDENNQWNFVTLNLPSSANNNANFALKFDGELGSGNDNVWIDDVTVSGDAIVVDTDQDGIPDEDDNCPAVSNQNQADADNDSIGDVCDSDTDGDTVANDVDNCPAIQNTNQANFDGDALGDACDDSTDYCLILDGVQTQNDVCQLPPEDDDEDDDEDIVDVCPFKPGNQVSLSDCFDLPEDKCPNVPGHQFTNLLCSTPFDWCPDVPGTQHSLWQCFGDDDDDDDDEDPEYCSEDDDNDRRHHDDDDDCIPPPVDYCDTLDGVQTEDADCPPPTPICDEGEIIVDNQCVPEPQKCLNLLENGSFETEVVTHPDLWDRFGIVTGWTIQQVLGGAATTLELQRDWSSNEAAEGAQYAELDGDHSTKISQTVALTNGATYELKWAFAARHDIDASQNQLSVMIDGTEVDTNGPATALANLVPADWIQGSYTFVADDTSAIIGFADVGPSDSFGTFVDDARLCKIADPEPVATVVAEKIVCETEADLPNWNDTEGGAPNITADTAADWVEQSDGACWLEEDWQFEWGSANASDPGDTLVGAAGAGWDTLAPTNGVGKTSIFLTEEDLDDDSFIWMREVLEEGYIPFTHGADSDNSDNVTAEMYCHVDGLNYDNLDRIDGIELNETYHCVAFNAEIPKPVEYCTLEMNSDAGTVVVERNGYAIPTYDGHDAWQAEIPGATWVWNSFEADEIDEGEDQIFTFRESFFVVNPTVADLDIAADNDYELSVNGVVKVPFSGESNYGSLTKDDIDLLPYVTSGTTTITVKVKNFGLSNSNYLQNPAGLLYKLTVKGDDTASCKVTTAPDPETPVEVCEYNEALAADDELCVPPPTPCPYNENLVVGDVACVPPPAVCEYNESLDAEDELCVPPTITPEDEDNTETNRRSGGSSTKIKKKPAPAVLGASTSQCSMYLLDYMKSGLPNDEFEVKKLQLFLNIVQGNNIPVTGVFDTATDEAVRAFQLKYQSEVLTPWFVAGFVPHQNPTGWVYQLTRWKINNIVCPGSELSPTLLP